MYSHLHIEGSRTNFILWCKKRNTKNALKIKIIKINILKTDKLMKLIKYGSYGLNIDGIYEETLLKWTVFYVALLMTSLMITF